MHPATSAGPRPWLRRLPFLAILAGAAAGAALLGDRLSLAALAEHRAALIALRDANYALAALAFVAGYAAIVTFSLPGALLATLTGGFLFGTFPGVLFNVTGATIGAVLVFLAARAGFGARLAARIDASDGRIRDIKRGLAENEIPVLLLLRLVPVVPFFLANLIPAAMGVGLARFAATTFVGIIPGALVYTAAGAGLGEVLARGEAPDLGLIFEPQVLAPLLGLAALAALPILLRALRARRGA
jgi:uncharacterized membrane protein YdjX (TVP38/TMEM64 family)